MVMDIGHCATHLYAFLWLHSWPWCGTSYSYVAVLGCIILFAVLTHLAAESEEKLFGYTFGFSNVPTFGISKSITLKKMFHACGSILERTCLYAYKAGAIKYESLNQLSPISKFILLI